MKSYLSYIKIFLFILILPFLSCNPSKKLQENQYLLTKNVININNRDIDYEELSAYIKQKPNKKILGLIKFHLGVYNMVGNKKETRFNNWLKDTIGEPPVILDTNLTNKTIRQFRLYLNNKGYFNSGVCKKIEYRKKKAKVFYDISVSKPYKIRNIFYATDNSVISYDIHRDSINSLLKPGNNYDVDILQKERERITRMLRSDGYYDFSKDFITYKIDSSFNSNQMDIIININDPVLISKENPDSLLNTYHKRYGINNIYIYSSYNLTKNTTTADTVPVTIKPRRKGGTPSLYYFITDKKMHINPKIITQSTFINSHSLYNINDVEQTYDRLSALQNFKLINISFKDPMNDSLKGKELLDCHIQLTAFPKRSITFEAEGTNSEGDIGCAGNIVFQNKNFFRGAEIFNIKLKGALEVQKSRSISSSDATISNLIPFFNTMEYGIESSIEIPKFLMPVGQEKFPKYFNPKSTINTGFNFQENPQYTRYVANIAFGYDWKESAYKRHILNPIEISSVKITTDSAFTAHLSMLYDKSIQNSYTNHLISGLKYSFIFNNQQINKLRDFVFFRGNLETAGNLLRLYNSTFKSIKNDDNSYTLFNIRYAQYVRADIDFRYYSIFNELNTLAFRFRAGIGFPYGNMNTMPFEKSFFCGGANSIRAWPIRSVGPGSYYSTANKFDRIGDIIIESNLEYRFPVYKVLRGALFVDAGNVWLKNYNSDFPGGDFKFNSFIEELAVGSGIGLRFDFSLFIIRLDAAYPVKYPYPVTSHKILASDIVYNLGIGYPF